MHYNQLLQNKINCLVMTQFAGGGFCVYADITLAVRMLLTLNLVKKVVILDVDAHQVIFYLLDLQLLCYCLYRT